ncbi:hypothetical protein CBS101457_002451 [Exobasidium rhododendri]|nr:hypothetical protein CBS101457_002451 [Exobasidium rhododendri]
MSHNRRSAPGGPGRDQNQRIVSGARAAPYSRPETSRRASSGIRQEEKADTSSSKAWPPNQLSIRGASGPFWVVVANLLHGTTEADIQETFQQFGEIEDVHPRKAPSDNHPSVAFEIAFTLRSSADSAIEKLDGALADGRLLQVSLRDPNKFNTISQAVLPPVAVQVVSAPAAAPIHQRELMPTIPSGPRAQQHSANGGRELLQPNIKQQQQQQYIVEQPHARQRSQIVAPVVAAAPSLHSRLMSVNELKTLQRQQARAAIVGKVVPGVPKGPKGTVSTPATSVPLAKRIALPLAMRLSEEAKKSGPASGKVSTPSAPGKKRKAKGKARRKDSNGMDVD